MSNDIFDIRNEIRLAKLDIELLQRLPCTKEDNKMYARMIQEGNALPEGIFQYETATGTKLDEFYSVYDPQLTEKEQQEYIALMQYKELKTIKKCTVVLTVLASIAAAFGLWIIICSIL